MRQVLPSLPSVAPFPSHLEYLGQDSALLNLEFPWETLAGLYREGGFCAEGVASHQGWMTLASVPGWGG